MSITVLKIFVVGPGRVAVWAFRIFVDGVSVFSMTWMRFNLWHVVVSSRLTILVSLIMILVILTDKFGSSAAIQTIQTLQSQIVPLCSRNIFFLMSL